MAPFALLLGIGPLVRWGRDRPRKLQRLLIITLVSIFVLLLLLPWMFENRIVATTVVGLTMACWIGVLALAEAVQRMSRGMKMTPATGTWWRRTSA